jgi:hypothetical protein
MANRNGAQQTKVCRQVIRELRAEFALHDPDAFDLLNQQERMDVFLSEVIAAARKALTKAPKLFSYASTYALGAVNGKKTRKCCTGKLWHYRDGDFDNCLPANQSGADAGTITVLTPTKNWTFAEAAISVLNVSPDTPVDVLGKLLKERGHTMTLAQAESMTEATERGDKTGMVTNGWGNFFFVENKDGGISVVSVRRRDGIRLWCAGVGGLEYSYCWRADLRIMVSNLDTSKLGL